VAQTPIHCSPCFTPAISIHCRVGACALVHTLRIDAHRSMPIPVRDGGASGARPGTVFALCAAPTMSQKVVQSLIGQLLTDAELRAHFVDAPLDTLLALRDSGVELTRTEIEGLVQIDQEFWNVAAERIHPSLQRWRLRPN
jgi:hypothetical protein